MRVLPTFLMFQDFQVLERILGALFCILPCSCPGRVVRSTCLCQTGLWYDVRAMIIVCTSPISILIGIALVISTFVSNASAGFHTLILSQQIIFFAASSVMVLKLAPKSIRAVSLLYQI